MHDYRSTSIELIRKHRLPKVDFSKEFIFPHYQGLSIYNLPASIFHWLCVEPLSSPALQSSILQNLLPTYSHIILLVVDSLGSNLFDPYMERILNDGQKSPWHTLLEDAVITCLTSISPSTTAAALTSLWTGRQPIEHGIIGYELWLKEYGALVNMITHSIVAFSNQSGHLAHAGFQPQNFLSVPTLTSILNTHGVKVSTIQHSTIYNSGLSTMLYTSAAALPYSSYTELWTTLYDLLASSNGKTLTYIYWGDLDTLSHRFGPNDDIVRQEWDTFASLLVQCLLRLHHIKKEKTLFLLTADHGQIPTPKKSEFDLRQHPKLLRMLIMPPSGEGRMPYLFIHYNQADAVREYLAQHWGDTFMLLTANDFQTSGLLGDAQPHTAIQDRTGDFIVIPRENAYWWWANKENPLLGRHGGLLAEEMLVPLLAIPL